MSDKEPKGRSDARYYQAHKDDDAEWDDDVDSPRQPKRRLNSMISVRFAPEEETDVREAAKRAGESVSNFVRMAALMRVRPALIAVSVTRSAVQLAVAGSDGLGNQNVGAPTGTLAATG